MIRNGQTNAEIFISKKRQYVHFEDPAQTSIGTNSYKQIVNITTPEGRQKVTEELLWLQKYGGKPTGEDYVGIDR